MELVDGHRFPVGLNAPSTKEAIATLVSEKETNTTVFSLRGIAANMGTAAAGLLTYYIWGGASALIFYVSAGMYVLLGAMSWILIPKGCGDAPCKIIPLNTYIDIFRNKAFVVFSLVSIFIWALYTQLSLGLPLRAEGVLPDPGIVSLIWTINSVIVIVLQTPISRWIIEKINPMYTLSLGVLFIGAGLGSLYWSTTFYQLIISGAIFIIGEMLILPTMDATISRIGAAHMIGAFFGISNFISGIGEGAGKFFGGQLLGLGTPSATPWITYAVFAIVVSIAVAVLRFWQPMKLSIERAQLEPDQIEVEKNSYPSFVQWVLGKKK